MESDSRMFVGMNLSRKGGAVVVSAAFIELRRPSSIVVRGERYALSGVEQRVLPKWLLNLKQPVAIFCSHDLRAHQVLEICQRNGIAVPGEVAILGVDDDTILCGFTSPTISSIDPDGAETGHMAAQTVIRMATNAACRRCPSCILIKPSRLIVRDSSEIYPVEPAWLSDALIYIQPKNGSSTVNTERA